MQYTTSEAAYFLGVSRARVRQVILAGKLPAKKIGRDWMIEKNDLVAYEPGSHGGYRHGEKRQVPETKEEKGSRKKIKKTLDSS